MAAPQLEPIEGLASLPTETLEDQIGELAAHINAATCRFLLLIAEFDRREGWQEWGCKSCADWLSLRCGLGIGAGREHVRTGRRLESMPLARAAFEQGELSYSKVRAITRVADHADESELVELARHTTASQLERLVRKYRWVIATQVEPANHIHNSRLMTWEWDDDGSLSFRGRLPAEDGTLLLRALEAAHDRLRSSPETPEGDEGVDAGEATCDDETVAPPSHERMRGFPCEAGDVSAETSTGEPVGHPRATNADALTLMAETLLAAGGASQRPAGERYQVVVHVDSADLEGATEHAEHCELEDGLPRPIETARRMACDASIVAMTLPDGRPLTVGRKTRSIPPALRRALRTRDGCCQFPGCPERRFVDAHHIRHWAHGGETRLSNLLLLCRRHHRLLHEGGFTLERTGDGKATFRRPDGRAIPRNQDRRRGSCDEVRRVLAATGAEVGPDTGWATSRGERLDYVNTVEGLLVGAGLLEFGRLDGRDVSAETRPDVPA